MAIKWPKMTRESSLKKQKCSKIILFNLSAPEFSYLISKKFYDVISDKA